MAFVDILNKWCLITNAAWRIWAFADVTYFYMHKTFIRITYTRLWYLYDSYIEYDTIKWCCVGTNMCLIWENSININFVNYTFFCLNNKSIHMCTFVRRNMFEFHPIQEKWYHTLNLIKNYLTLGLKERQKVAHILLCECTWTRNVMWILNPIPQIR